jgi:hypothetical protein
MITPALVLLAACSGEDEDPVLVLEGPDRVRVDRLGVVLGPDVRLDDGSVPHGLIWSLSPAGVARVDGQQLVAEGPGEVRVVAEWEEQQVEWTLVVELATMLAFVDLPATVPMGREVELKLAAHMGDRPIEPGPVDWSTSDPAVLVIVDGRARGVSPGMAYITATARGAQAMAELEVTP